MIVNCFQIFRTIRVRREYVNFGERRERALVAHPDDVDKIVGALAQTYEWSGLYGDEKCVEATQLILNCSHYCEPSYLTGAEFSIVKTIHTWLATELGTCYEDGWGMKTTATSRLVFENHNRAVGVMLHCLEVKKG